MAISLSRGFLSFIVGTLFGLFVVRWFVALLPGPRIEASIRGVRATSGNAAGCTFYIFFLKTDAPVDYVYAKIQFPTKINNYKVGFPQEAQMPNTGRNSMQLWDLSKDSAGECTVVQAAVSNDTDIQSSAAGNMIGINASKLPPEAIIEGVISTSEHQSAVNPLPNLYTEGAYEYPKLGQTVRRMLTIANSGVSDLREP
ncbi:MAG TPA: hypothetical protein VLZ50_04895 [Terracidiphilus sp.]|nr:hypothetical protein [Terracidiphilus sp.]